MTHARASDLIVRMEPGPPRAIKQLRFAESGIELTLEEQEHTLADAESMQSNLWPCAAFLCRSLQDGRTLFPARDETDPCRRRLVVELGSGCGACGLVAAKHLDADVIFTDYPQLLQLLERNAQRNGVTASAHVRALEWGAAEAEAFVSGLPAELSRRPIDMIIGSDITVFVQTLDELEATIHRLAIADHTQVCLAHHNRGGDLRYVLEAFGRRFAIERLTPAWHHSPEHVLLRLRKRRDGETSNVGGARSDSACSDERSAAEPPPDEVPEEIIRAAAVRGSVRDLAELKRRLALSGGPAAL